MLWEQNHVLITFLVTYYHLINNSSWLLETPCESRDFESSKASFNNGFKLSVCSLARYKIACELIKFCRLVLAYGPTCPRLRAYLSRSELSAGRVVRHSVSSISFGEYLFQSTRHFGFFIYLKDNYYLLVKMNYLLNDNIKWPKMWLGRDFVLITWSITYHLQE
jgi:hypothetical protein